MNQFFDEKFTGSLYLRRNNIFHDACQASNKKCVVKYVNEDKYKTTVEDLDNEKWKQFCVGLRKQQYFVF